jgi:excisionase family DNA binding protein
MTADEQEALATVHRMLNQLTKPTEHQTNPALLVDVRQAAELLGVSAATVRRLTSNNKLQSIVVAGCRRWRTADLQTFVSGAPTAPLRQ